MLSADSTRRESHAAAQDVFQPVLTQKILIVLARVGLVIHAQNMVQCAAFDLDATIKAAIRVWKGVVEYSPRPWMPATWFSATVASAESGSGTADADWYCHWHW